VERLLREYGARAVVIRKDFTVFETTGQREETDGLVKALEPYGLIEFVRSARVAIIKDSRGFTKNSKNSNSPNPAKRSSKTNTSTNRTKSLACKDKPHRGRLTNL